MQHPATPPLTPGDIKAAAERIAGHVRPVTVAPADGHTVLALEFMQHTGSFKARGAMNFLLAHREAGLLPEAGLTLASGGNAGLACAWAARAHGVRATVFLPGTAPPVKVARLRSYGAEVRLVGTRYDEARAACAEFASASGALASASGALASHAYDHPLIAAGAGTLTEEILRRVPEGLDTLVVSVGGGGLFAGVATAALEAGVEVVAVEPENCRALNAALAAGRVVDAAVDSVAADSLGATRVSETALAVARRPGVRSVLVPDAAIVRARQQLWDERRLAVEHAAATACAYTPEPGERAAIVLCGANTGLGDLA
ncbi:serine/threonine dehydratase [Streptomyces sp. CA-294286]|uniref:serine/threonine dehydratase n=1 Tax=Streptomyces sp. CA-294286 TaxID=3240070 RepID=UPI003D90DCB6